jgi:hypothetical protein
MVGPFALIVAAVKRGTVAHTGQAISRRTICVDHVTTKEVEL